MIATKAFAAPKAKAPLGPFQLSRREPREHDVVIESLYCGICHSDIHQVREEWGGAAFPMVPGHEITGKVTKVGSKVTQFKVGDPVGVGCFIDSCRECEYCKQGLEQFCDGTVFTYNANEKDGTPTYGGYSSSQVVDEKYVLKIPANMPLDRAAPLLCAGITTYSPLSHWKVTKGQQVGIVGLGGLGHMGVKIAASMGAEVTVFSTSPSKEADAKKLGAHHFVVTRPDDAVKALKTRFHFILDAVSAPHNYNTYLNLLKADGTMAIVGVPPEAIPVEAFSLILRRRSLSGSLIGGIAETQEMLDYCGAKNVLPDIELVSAKDINNSYERMIKGDVRYRFVIDLKTL